MYSARELRQVLQSVPLLEGWDQGSSHLMSAPGRFSRQDLTLAGLSSYTAGMARANPDKGRRGIQLPVCAISGAPTFPFLFLKIQIGEGKGTQALLSAVPVLMQAYSQPPRL